jgi:hypothetical protein
LNGELEITCHFGVRAFKKAQQAASHTTLKLPKITVKELLHNTFEHSKVLLTCFNIIKDMNMPNI